MPLADLPQDNLTQNEDSLTEISNQGVPLTDAPEELVEISNEDVPQTELPEEKLVEIPDGNVPLADVPKTGDSSLIWNALALLSGTGLVLLALDKKRRGSAE